MPWQVTISLQVIFNSFRTVQNRRIGLSRKDLSYYALSASMISVFATGIIFASFNWSKVDHSLAISKWPFLLLGGILFAFVNLLGLKLFRYVIASIAIFMAITNTLSTIIFANLLTSETLDYKQWFGVIVLIVAVSLVAYITKKTNKKKQDNVILSFVIVVAVALLIGPAIINEKYLIETIGLETYVIYGWGFQALCSVILAFSVSKGRIGVLNNSLKTHINVWAYALLLGLAGLSFVASIKNSGSASLVAASSTAVVAVTIMLAYFILNERSYLFAKLVGLFLSFIGLFLLFT